ncbi:hypothetical protein LTR78_005486 [Recurvomyces mirabilis]|uniref:Uncharacterized protein n=1 Tax=Recurvomyces mirabilis TaxID=574656 RepID=A0AAE0WN05_9PEZI|nr:hypothetical protein LTR78_005486 [Recurvomyces mirabilis]KAK5152605.1 hypothetical protein LTS14_008139 [Recurvomyces mirabilis]
MLLTTAGIVIGRKIKDERARKKEAKQGLLSVGNDELAKRAFDRQTARTLASEHESSIGLLRAGTDSKFEDPASVEATSSGVDSSPLRPPDGSSVKSPSTPRTVNLASTLTQSQNFGQAGRTINRQSAGGPPPYSPMEGTARGATSSIYSQDSDRPALTYSSSDTRSIMTSSSEGGDTIKIRTNGSDLKSGFPYHPALFDVNVHPSIWDTFTARVVESTKLTGKDQMQVWAAATGVALTGAINDSLNAREESQNRSRRHSAGALGETLEQWNDTYFRQRGLLVHLELSEASVKGKSLRKPASLFDSREERDIKREQRKFVIVISKLEGESRPMEGLDEVQEMAAEDVVTELPVVDGAKYNIAEMPGDEGMYAVELPVELPFGLSLGYGNEKLAAPLGLAELESNTSDLLNTSRGSDEKNKDEWTTDLAKEKPLMVTGSVHEALNKETT